MPDTPLLILDDLAVAVPDGSRRLLEGVRLKLEPGDCVALVGPSGSGKTTFLRTLNGQLPAAAGAVRIAGRELEGLRGEALRRLRRQVALIGQKHDLVEALPAHANVMAGALGRWSNLRALRYLARPSREELAEAAAALAAVGLEDKLRAPTARMSGGEQQRVAIARALVQDARLLLADEPVASLDPATAREVLELLTGLVRSRGMALICSLHQPELAARYFDRVLELKDGRLVQAGAAGP